MVLDILNKERKGKLVKTLTRNILLKNIDCIIIYQNEKIQVKFKKGVI